jgi:hypothetical protein
MTFKKTKLVLGIATATLTMSAAFLSPEALAHHSAKKHTHKASRSARSVSSRTSYSQVDALSSQVRAMQDEIASLRAAQTAAPVAAVDSAKVEELDQWMASVKAAPVIEKTKDNMMFFRGGYSHMNSPRGGTLDPTIVPGVASSINGVAVGPIGHKDAWYFGAGFDFSLNNNLFGLMDDTEVAAELMFDYKELGKGNNGLSPQEVAVVNTLRGATTTNVATVTNPNGTLNVNNAALANTNINGTTNFNLPAANTATATVSQFSLAASPKIKFLKGSAFRPWLIPVGFEMSVISPPSNAITVLQPGMQFGFGADYKVWKDLYIGADARYHQALGRIDGVNTNGVTAGGYLGLGF